MVGVRGGARTRSRALRRRDREDARGLRLLAATHQDHTEGRETRDEANGSLPSSSGPTSGTGVFAASSSATGVYVVDVSVQVLC